MTGRRSIATAVGALLALAVAAFAHVTTETLPIGLLLLITADLDVSPSTAGLLVTYYGRRSRPSGWSRCQGWRSPP